jgi:putative acetyltransferase
MIRTFKQEDLPNVMEIWLNTNVQAHSFIAREYWTDNFHMVKGMLPNAEVYVYEADNKIEAFVGVDNGYIAGIFVSAEMQSKGIGKLLLGKCKELYSALSLSVYKRNSKALRFYMREGFAFDRHQLDENTGEVAYLMIWRK